MLKVENCYVWTHSVKDYEKAWFYELLVKSPLCFINTSFILNKQKGEEFTLDCGTYAFIYNGFQYVGQSSKEVKQTFETYIQDNEYPKSDDECDGLFEIFRYIADDAYKFAQNQLQNTSAL